MLNSFRILSKAVSSETIVLASSASCMLCRLFVVVCFCVGTVEPKVLLFCGQGWAGVCLVLILLLVCWGPSICFVIAVEWELAGMILTMSSLLLSSIVCNQEKLFIMLGSSSGNNTRHSFWLPPELLLVLLHGNWEGMMTAVILSLSRWSSIFNWETISWWQC